MLLQTLFLTSRFGQNVIKAFFWLTMLFWIASSCTTKNTKISNNIIRPTLQNSVHNSAQIVAHNNAQIRASQRRYYQNRESLYNRYKNRNNNQMHNGFNTVNRTLTTANKLVNIIGRISN
jgi:hypothetical protein